MITSRIPQSDAKTLTIANADESINNALSLQNDLRAAMFNGITEDDVRAIVAKQVERAKEGDPASLKFVFEQVLGTKTPISIKQTNVITDVATAARIAKEAGS
jgi:plasmid stability protein